jgi:hypothetical protein
MRYIVSVVTVALVAIATGQIQAGRKKTVNPRVREVRTIFIKGNNEAAVRARESLEKFTCFRLASNPSQADATLELSQQQSVNGAIFLGSRERTIVSAELTNKDGDLLWSDSATQGAGFINTGAGSAALYILYHLQNNAFPEAKLGFGDIGTLGAGVNQSICRVMDIGRPVPTEAPTGAPDPTPQNQPLVNETKEIKLGMSADEVERILGGPAIKVDLGEKVLYKYKDMTIEFRSGRVTDVR